MTTEKSPKKKQFQFNSSVYRLNISYLSGAVFGEFISLDKKQKREPGVSPKLDELKRHVLELLIVNERHRGLKDYTIAWQTHTSCPLAHLDILLLYEKTIKKSQSSFDYLLSICPQDVDYFSDKQGKKPQIFITGYSLSRLNVAILEYGTKEDPDPLNTFTKDTSERVMNLAALREDPFRYLYEVMKKDPYNFQLGYYTTKYDIITEVRGWSAVKHKLMDAQTALRAMEEERKPGILPITRELIEANLTYEQLLTFDTYPCFQTIVDHLNQIPSYGSQRPHKTLNLFIYGKQGIGKTSFLNQGPTNLSQLVPFYDINLQNKYLNRYYNNVYGFIAWNEFKYTDFTPTFVLKLLEGLDLQIPIRYATNVKRDNPLVIATSNMSLTEHIERRFKGQEGLIKMAKSNLIGERITEVNVPVPMFFMQKLLIKAKPPEIFS